VTAERSALDRFFRNPKTGKVVIAQFPNVPLWIFFATTLVRLVFHPHGVAGTAVSVIGTVSLTWWSVDEIWRGDSPFRRVLGALVLAGLVMRVVTAVFG
jgi:hypothetical protein